MILSIKMHPACGQNHSSRVHFLLCSQADIKSPASRDFLQKLSVVRAVSVFLWSTLLAKSEQNASAKNAADSSHLPKFCPECIFCWTMPPGCAKTMSGTRNGAGLQVKRAIAGFLFFWESVKKLEEAFLMKACSPLRSEHKQRNL